MVVKNFKEVYLVKKIVLFLSAVLIIGLTFADEKLLFVEAEVFKVNATQESASLKDVLSKATLEQNPKMLANYGQEAGLKISYEGKQQSDSSVLEILFNSNQAAQTYDIDINLVNGDVKNISQISNHPIGQQSIVSTIINDESKIIKINVTETNNPAQVASVKSTSDGIDKVSYLLQVTSDLQCEQLDIEFISESGTTQMLSYTTSAFAALDLQPGVYAYGNLTCTRDGTAESFSVLNDRLEVVTLSAGSHYYGGRLIFTKQKNLDANANPEVLDNCPEVISRARGEASNECRDGVGVDTSAALTNQINIFAPEVTESELEAIRKALSVDESQLQYLPIKLK